MANIGRGYKRLFERDLGFRTTSFFSYLPNRYHMPALPLLPSNCIRYTNTREASDVGVADYSAGKVSYTWTPSAAITPGAFARLEWYLTDDANFGRFRLYQGKSGVDWWYCDGNVTNPNFPTASGFNTPVWLISPVPSCFPFPFTPTPWLWTYGAPQ